MSSAQPFLTVHKFGGASLADGAAMRNAVSIVRNQRSGSMVIVVSALGGVTDSLLDVARKVGNGDARTIGPILDKVRSRYIECARALLAKGGERDKLLRQINESFGDLKQFARVAAVNRGFSARSSDYIVARGEQVSALIFTAALQAAGCQARYVDSTDVIKMTDGFGGPFPDLALIDKCAPKILGPLLRRGIIPVVPGFIGAMPNGEVATLGRGGSDFTATLLGRALKAREISLWKDVPGLLTADPGIVPDARLIPQLNVREAAELAYYGAKVVHPRALIPIAERSTAVYVRPFADQASSGTEISRRRTLSAYPVKALSAIGAQALVTVEGNGMLGVPGIAARTFSALHRAGISVSLISQASSEHSICFAVPENAAQQVRVNLLQEFEIEIGRREIDGVSVRTGMSTLAVVGLGMAGTPGVAARIFSALSLAGINVVAIAQGSSELNISVVVDATDTANAQRSVHAAFQLNKIGGGSVHRSQRVDVVLLGFGQIGRALASMIVKVRRNSVTPRVTAVIDRSGFVFDARGISARRLASLAESKLGGVPLAQAKFGRGGTALQAVTFIAQHALSNPIFVDATADDSTDVLKAALASGMDVVLANKKPLTGRKKKVDEIHATAREHGRRLRHETTVGAGLPIIDTYYKLTESGDRVYKIEGCPSGTMGYLFGELGRGRRFSEALRGAMAKGYTEPDPRDDLSGMDVARKALILGRLLGHTGELEDVAVESLVPEDARELPLDKFLARLERYDDMWEQQVNVARARGAVLRYRATVTRRKIAVGLLVVQLGSSMASLNGTDNQFIFTTKRYKTNPLVITGPGAGPVVTAAGVLNDVLKLAGA